MKISHIIFLYSRHYGQQKYALPNIDLSYLPSKCETSPAFQTDTPVCKSNISYLIEEKCKPKKLFAHLYYMFPHAEDCHKASVKNGLYILKVFLS